jgi:hypothetical protein
MKRKKPEREKVCKRDLLLFCQALGVEASIRWSAEALCNKIAAELRGLDKRIVAEVRSVLHRLLLVDPDEEWIVDTEEVDSSPLAQGKPAVKQVSVWMLVEPGRWDTRRLIATGRTQFLAYLAAVERCATGIRRMGELDAPRSIAEVQKEAQAVLDALRNPPPASQLSRNDAPRVPAKRGDCGRRGP